MQADPAGRSADGRLRGGSEMSIQLTAGQAKALVEITEREGTVSLRQLAIEHPTSEDVYAAPHGSTHGYRISGQGEVSRIETLPGEE
jgi:hypothetical protein